MLGKKRLVIVKVPNRDAIGISIQFSSHRVIDNIIVDTYTGAVGSLLQLLETDDTVVKTVEVTITAANGTLIEQGAALQNQAEANSPIWIYTATVVNSPVAGSKVTVVAKDLPGIQ